jgi:paraquat-inducible protein B
LVDEVFAQEVGVHCLFTPGKVKTLLELREKKDAEKTAEDVRKELEKAQKVALKVEKEAVALPKEEQAVLTKAARDKKKAEDRAEINARKEAREVTRQLRSEAKQHKQSVSKLLKGKKKVTIVLDPVTPGPVSESEASDGYESPSLY